MDDLFDRSLFLTKPSITYELSYKEMMEEWEKTGETPVPWVLKLEYQNFEKLVKYLTDLETGINLKEGQVKCSTYWLTNDEGKILGACNIRHELNEGLLKSGGHVGYGIRPSERKNGYGTIILKLSIEKLKEMGIKKILVTCNHDNVGSEMVILNNGGAMDSIVVDEDGVLVKRFWIEV